jgi:hypothetical protein
MVLLAFNFMTHRELVIVPFLLSLPKASLNRGFMVQLPKHSYFGNNAEEFYPYETISAPMKLSSSLFINIVSYQYI